MTWPCLYKTLPIDRLVELRQAGAHLDDIGRELGVTACVITRAFHYHGRADLCRLHNDRHVAEAADLYAQGLTEDQVGKRLGVDARTIGHWLHPLGITRPPHMSGKRLSNRVDIPREWLEEQIGYGFSYPEIAIIRGCHPQTVIKAAHRYGIRVDQGRRATTPPVAAPDLERAILRDVIRTSVDRVRQRVSPLPSEACGQTDMTTVPTPPVEWPDCPAWLVGILTEEA